MRARSTRNARRGLAPLLALPFLIGAASTAAAASPTVHGGIADEPVEQAGARAGFEAGTEVRDPDDHGGVHESAHGEQHGPAPVNWVDFGYGDKDAHGGELEMGDVPMPPPLVLALFNFAVFAGLLIWKGGPALSAYFKNKHETIKSSLEEGARLRSEAAAKLEEYGQRIKDVDAEVAALTAQFRAEAAAERERVLADAKLQAERTRKEAAARIEAEIAAARRQLQREVVAAATAAAETLLRERASTTDQSQLVENFLARIGGEPSAAAAVPPVGSDVTDEGWS